MPSRGASVHRVGESFTPFHVTSVLPHVAGTDGGTVCHCIRSSGLYFNWFGHADCGQSRVKTHRHCADTPNYYLQLTIQLLIVRLLFTGRVLSLHYSTRRWTSTPSCYLPLCIGCERVSLFSVIQHSRNSVTIVKWILNFLLSPGGIFNLYWPNGTSLAQMISYWVKHFYQNNIKICKIITIFNM